MVLAIKASKILCFEKKRNEENGWVLKFLLFSVVENASWNPAFLSGYEYFRARLKSAEINCSHKSAFISMVILMLNWVELETPFDSDHSDNEY